MWTIYREVREGELLWQSYKQDVSGGVLFREAFGYIDRASGLVKAMAEATCFVAGSPDDLEWVLDSDQESGERRSRVYSTTAGSGTAYLNLVEYIDQATAGIKAASASISAPANVEGAGDVTSVNGQDGDVELDSDDIAEGSTNLYFSGKDTDDLPEGSTNEYYTDAKADARVDAGILYFDSAAGAGGTASETMTVTGLLATDEILSVTQMTPGANSLPMLGFANQDDDALDITWSADPGAGSVVRVAVKRIA